MIEEIARPDISLPFYGLLSMIVGAFVMFFYPMFSCKHENIMWAGLAILIVLTFALFFITSPNSEYEEAVREQIADLGCDDLQEAHRIYGLEEIKERFLFECVDTREAWYLD